jgi:hypothetical protein
LSEMVRTESSSFLTWGNQVKKYRKRNFHLLLSEFRSGNFAKFRHIMHPWLRLYPQVKIPIHKKVTSLSLLGVSTPIFGVTFRRFGASFPRSCAQMGRTWVRRFSDYGSYLNNHPIFLKVSDMESSMSQTYGNLKNFSFLTLSVPLLFFSGTHATHFRRAHAQTGLLFRGLTPKREALGSVEFRISVRAIITTQFS